MSGGEFAFDVSPVMELVGREFKGSELLPPGVTEVPDAIRLSVLSAVADRVMAGIVAGWPVDTGKSLAGFHTLPFGRGWQVRNNVDYTDFVHDGLVDRLAADELKDSIPFARKLTRNLLRRMASQPGTRQRVSIDAQRKRGAVPASVQAVADTLSAAGAAPEPVIALFREGKTSEALSLLTTMLSAQSVSSSAMIATAESLVRAGRVSRSVLALLRAGNVTEALARLVRAGKAVEAQAIARARL